MLRDALNRLTVRFLILLCSYVTLLAAGCKTVSQSHLHVRTSAMVRVRLLPPDGIIRVIDAPQLRGHDPYTIRSGATRALSTLSVFNAMGPRLMELSSPALSARFADPANVDARFEAQMTVSINGVVDIASEAFLDGTSIGSVVLFQDGRAFATLSDTLRISGFSAAPAPAVLLSVDANNGLEVEGHSDPNCKRSWLKFSCVTTGVHCLHKIRDLFTGKCYGEECEWVWYNLACGCVRGEEIRCP